LLELELIGVDIAPMRFATLAGLDAMSRIASVPGLLPLFS